MKTFLFFFTIGMLLGCAGPGKINLLPMYGHQPKAQYFIDADNKFITEAIEEHGSADSASRHCVKMGWAYFYRKDINTAMKRFNQAWLLDSLNPDIYWGFGSILGVKHAPIDTVISFLNLSRQLGNKNNRLVSTIAYAYGQKAIQLKNKTDSTWVFYHDSSMNLFTSIEPFTKKDCDLTMQYWEIALLLDDKRNVARSQFIIDSTGYMPWNKPQYDALVNETNKRQK